MTSRTHHALTTAVLLGCLCAGAGMPTRGNHAVQPSQALPATISSIDTRLSALTPDQPLGYLLLAEELAVESRADKLSRDFARQLYVIAFDIFRHRAQPGDAEYARSACIGLASLTVNQGQRRWLAAVGDLCAPPSASGLSAVAKIPSPVPEATALNLATAMGLARAGDGKRAEAYINRSGVRDLLANADAAVSGGRTTGTPHVLKWINDWPACPTCKNRRIVTRGSESVVCQYCDGNPGPKLSDQELIVQLRAESLLLRGVYRSWSAQLLADEGDPLRDPNPTDVASSFGVDPKANLWRSGAWTTP